MTTTIFILATGYYLIMSLITLGILAYRNKRTNTEKLSVTVIVVARNEEKILPTLLDSLTTQIYPKDRYDIFLLNDDSNDTTGEIMQSYCQNRDNWHYFDHKKTENSLIGKKGAITLGVEKSDSDIILLTDADCIIPPKWIQSMVSCFTPETGMVLGCSPVIKKPGFFNVYQRFDTLCEATLAAATTFYNNPSHSNARNLAFRKQAFHDVGGYRSVSHVSTGDDFYLTNLIRTKSKWKFSYNMARESFIPTEEISFGKAWIHQQLRRNSKGFDLTLPFFIMGAWIVLFHACLLALIFTPAKWPLLISLLSIKFLVELAPVAIGAVRFRYLDLLLWFPVLWIVYPVIYLTSQLLGLLRLYKWK